MELRTVAYQAIWFECREFCMSGYTNEPHAEDSCAYLFATTDTEDEAEQICAYWRRQPDFTDKTIVAIPMRLRFETAEEVLTRYARHRPS